jgi:peroxiredoxin Q/BCP
MASIKTGDHAPDFTATDQQGESLSLQQFRGQHTVVLFFYPKDESPVCTAEACAFRDAYEDFVTAGAVVIGISQDSSDSHAKFAQHHGLPFRLIADSDGAIRKAFGVPKSLVLLPGRVTYVIDRQGIVRHVFSSQFLADRHVSEALKCVRELAATEATENG